LPAVVIPVIKTASEEPFGYRIAESHALTHPSAFGDGREEFYVDLVDTSLRKRPLIRTTTKSSDAPSGASMSLRCRRSSLRSPEFSS
jgi:hypothetical protein